MATHETNPHPMNGPEWQLWENMQTYERSASVFAADADALMKKANEARKIADRYRATLEKLARAEG